jgi:uncharacterized protein
MQQSVRRILFFFLTLSTLVVSAQSTALPERPNPPRLVTDFTMTLSGEQQQLLEQKLRNYNDSTSTQIAIVVVKDLGLYEISDYAIALGQKWGIGQKDKDNGLLILWSTGNRKIYIATGYGMEEKVPDAIAKRIVNQLIVPYFREARYYEGLDLATSEIAARLSGTYQAEPIEEEGDGLFFFFLIFVLLIFVFIFLASKSRNNRFNDRNRGGGMMSGGGFYPPWIITHGGSGPSGWGNSGGGWDSGGGSDFGGFGGGDFGGGGAGGDY